jgi:hypothetical protein
MKSVISLSLCKYFQGVSLDNIKKEQFGAGDMAQAV